MQVDGIVGPATKDALYAAAPGPAPSGECFKTPNPDAAHRRLCRMSCVLSDANTTLHRRKARRVAPAGC
jgi:hypothetical protein